VLREMSCQHRIITCLCGSLVVRTLNRPGSHLYLLWFFGCAHIKHFFS